MEPSNDLLKQQDGILDEKSALQDLVQRQAEAIVVKDQMIQALEQSVSFRDRIIEKQKAEIDRIKAGLKKIIEMDDQRPRQIKDPTLRQLAVETLDPNRMKLSPS